MSGTIEEVRILRPHHKGDEDWHLGWDAWTRLNEAERGDGGAKGKQDNGRARST